MRHARRTRRAREAHGPCGEPFLSRQRRPAPSQGCRSEATRVAAHLLQERIGLAGSSHATNDGRGDRPPSPGTSACRHAPAAADSAAPNGGRAAAGPLSLRTVLWQLRPELERGASHRIAGHLEHLEYSGPVRSSLGAVQLIALSAVLHCRLRSSAAADRLRTPATSIRSSPRLAATDQRRLPRLCAGPAMKL